MILFIDSHSINFCVCLLNDGKVFSKREHSGKNHSEVAIPLINELYHNIALCAILKIGELIVLDIWIMAWMSTEKVAFSVCLWYHKANPHCSFGG